MTENHKYVGFLRSAPHIGFRSLLSHSSTVSQWIPCWVLYISGDKTLQCTFLSSLSDISVCCFMCWKMFTETVTFWQCGNPKNYTISLITSLLFVSHLTVWQSWRVDLYDVHKKNTWRSQLISGLWLWWEGELTVVSVVVVIGGAYCSYCGSGDRGAYCSYCGSGDSGSLL